MRANSIIRQINCYSPVPAERLLHVSRSHMVITQNTFEKFWWRAFKYSQYKFGWIYCHATSTSLSPRHCWRVVVFTRTVKSWTMVEIGPDHSHRTLLWKGINRLVKQWDKCLCSFGYYVWINNVISMCLLLLRFHLTDPYLYIYIVVYLHTHII